MTNTALMISTPAQFVEFVRLASLASTAPMGASIVVTAALTDDMYAFAAAKMAEFGAIPGLSISDEFLGIHVNTIVFTPDTHEVGELSAEAINAVYAVLGELNAEVSMASFRIASGVNYQKLKMTGEEVEAMVAFHAAEGSLQAIVVGDVISFQRP